MRFPQRDEKAACAVLKEKRAGGKNFLINPIVRWTRSGTAVVTCAQMGSTLLNASDIVRRTADVTKARGRVVRA